MDEARVRRTIIVAALSAPLLVSCGGRHAEWLCCQPAGETAAIAETAAPTWESTLRRDLERMAEATEPVFGEGGLAVLQIGYEGLLEARREGRGSDVGLEDLWAHAIKEGSILFADPNRRWGKTTAEETRDMIGQTTIGPWQITVQNVRQKYGIPYGIDSRWTDAEVYVFCRDNPRVQARMIIDLVQENYDRHGVRDPYAIQAYFWFEAFAKREIGQGDWQKSVLPVAPDGDWRKLTPELKADTGFYGKQLVCGTWTNPRGLLYWLAITGKDAEIAALGETWREARTIEWDRDANVPRRIDHRGEFALQPADLEHLRALDPDSAQRTVSILFPDPSI